MLRIIVSNKLEKLILKLHENINHKNIHPLAKIPLCVQTAGMQRWLGLKLSELSGISANLDYIFPGALMKRLVERTSDRKPSWPDKEELIWKVFKELQDINDPVYADISAYIENDLNSIKTYRLSGRIADTFDQYQVYRPEMVMKWLSPAPDKELKDEDLWQRDLLRRVFSNRDKCKTVLFDRYIKSCQKGAVSEKQLGGTIHLFGISVLPPFFMEMLRATAKVTDVNFYLLSPTNHYWGDSKSVKEIRREERYKGKLAEEIYIEEKHQLLDNLGMVGRDFFDHIYSSDDLYEDIDIYEEIEKETVIGSIQSEIMNLEQGEEKLSDDSIVIANCHNPLREVEALYDHLLDIFNKDSISPSDILVMTPEIEKYAPYIRSVFDNPYSENTLIPYSIADISEKMSSRPAGIFMELLKSIRGDFNLREVINLISYDIIADKFSIPLSDIPSIADVLNINGAYWGYGREHLDNCGLDIEDTFTWKKALQRIALGLTEGDSCRMYSVAAGNNVPFPMAEKLGGMMKFVDMSSNYAEMLRQKNTPERWCEIFFEMVENFFSSSQQYTDDLLYLTKSITRINEETSNAEFSEETFAEPVIERLDNLLSEVRGAKGFMTGKVTFCAMLPMRSIPFKHICIIGLNENTFPRQKKSLEFDLIAKKPRPGDRSNRDSDRYLFLETLLSVRDRLYLSYTGQSEKDNNEIPPSTLITELVQHLETRFGMRNIEIKHKLHSYSSDYFKKGRLFTYSPQKYEAAKALREEADIKQFCTTDIEAQELTDLALHRFEQALISPPKFFLENTLGIFSGINSKILPETEKMNFAGLNKYGIQSHSVQTALSGEDVREFLRYSKMTAQLPPENLGEYYAEETFSQVSDFASRINEISDTTPKLTDFETEIDGLTVRGRMEGIADNNHIFIKLSSVKPKDLIKAWARHLLLNNEREVITHILSPLEHLVMSPPHNGTYLSELVEIIRNAAKRPLLFHATDGYSLLDKELQIQGVDKKDDFSNLSIDPSFRICFRKGSENMDMTTLALKIFEPVKKHTEKRQ
jgi:exodeoxyribonuclease V gamma subunit